MYSSEIENFLKERNYVVTPRECGMIMNVDVNTQITNMKYFCTNNEYHIYTDDGYFFKFWVKP